MVPSDSREQRLRHAVGISFGRVIASERRLLSYARGSSNSSRAHTKVRHRPQRLEHRLLVGAGPVEADQTRRRGPGRAQERARTQLANLRLRPSDRTVNALR
jgi:hypothetical protein